MLIYSIQKCLFINKISCVATVANLPFVNTTTFLWESAHAKFSLAFASRDAVDLDT